MAHSAAAKPVVSRPELSSRSNKAAMAAMHAPVSIHKTECRFGALVGVRRATGGSWLRAPRLPPPATSPLSNPANYSAPTAPPGKGTGSSSG